MEEFQWYENWNKRKIWFIWAHQNIMCFSFKVLTLSSDGEFWSLKLFWHIYFLISNDINNLGTCVVSQILVKLHVSTISFNELKNQKFHIFNYPTLMWILVFMNNGPINKLSLSGIMILWYTSTTDFLDWFNNEIHEQWRSTIYTY